MPLSETSHSQPPTRVISLVSFPAALLAFITGLLLALRFRRSLPLRPFILTMWLLLTLDRSLRRLLPLILAWRTALLLDGRLRRLLPLMLGWGTALLLDGRLRRLLPLMLR
jgi:hypothetical protein